MLVVNLLVFGGCRNGNRGHHYNSIL